MYRSTNDPRFRRRLNELGQTLESANETAQSSLYIFGERYIAPCITSTTTCFTSCVDHACPGLRAGKNARDARGRPRDRAEASFDFYDDWDESEGEAEMGGWENEEFDRLVGGGMRSSVGTGYGTLGGVAQQPQPGRQLGMSYARTRRKSGGLGREVDGKVSGSFWTRLFGGRNAHAQYKPTAAGLQKHPGGKKASRAISEGEALLAEPGMNDALLGYGGRPRSGTATSGETTGSYSSRGDLFPSDEEDDAVPLDDEFAMVLERRTTASAPDTEAGSTRSHRRKGKRPLAGSRRSTRRSTSTRSMQSSTRRMSSRASSEPSSSPVLESPFEERIPSMSELKLEEHQLAEEDEPSIMQRRQVLQTAAEEHASAPLPPLEELAAKEVETEPTAKDPIEQSQTNAHATTAVDEHEGDDKAT